jgi:electron transport complex protein RnfG
MLKPTITLFIICFVAAFLLSLVNGFTKDIIAERSLEEAKQQRLEVMPEANKFNKIDTDSVSSEQISNFDTIQEVYEGYNNEEFIGYVFNVSPDGYGGEVAVTVGIDKDKTVTGVNIGDNNETPGLGSKASDESFIKQYFDKSIETAFEVVKTGSNSDNEIQAISGATITSSAVTSGVQSASDLANILIDEEGTK